MSKQKVLTPRQISTRVFKKLKTISGYSFLEQVAYFLGKCQIIEFGLKGLLSAKFGFDLDKMEKWTLGKTIKELKQQNLRPDFISVLEELLVSRNYVAHEILLDQAMIDSLVGNKPNRLVTKHLDHGLFQVEQSILLYDFLNKHNYW